MVLVPLFACKSLFANSSQFTRFDVYLLVTADPEEYKINSFISLNV